MNRHRDDWVQSTLGEVIAPSKDKADPKDFPDQPYVGLEHVEAHTMRLLGHGRGADVESTKSTFRKGDVLYGKLRPYLNKVVQPDFDGICSTDFLVFRESSQLDPDYLALFLNQSWIADAATQASRGVQLPRVNWESIAKLPVSFPRDKSEQRGIAGLLRNIRDRQSDARQHLSAANRAVDEFRHSVLAQAYEAAAGDLYGAGLVQLGSVLTAPLKNGYSARPVPYKTATKVLTLTATTTGYFDGRHFKFTDQTFSPESPYWVRNGDIYIQRGNTAELVGVPALYEGPDNQFLFPDLMIRVRAQPHIAPRFLWYMLLAPQTRAFLRERATGSAGNMPKINHSTLDTTPVPLASDSVRADLVARLDAALTGADAVKARLHEIERTLAAFAESTLAQCFGYGGFLGQVTPLVRKPSGS